MEIRDLEDNGFTEVLVFTLFPLFSPLTEEGEGWQNLWPESSLGPSLDSQSSQEQIPLHYVHRVLLF